MLQRLHVKNLVLISSLSLEFGHGLNILTGETGAGKSIIVDALSLLVGAKTASQLVRHGERAALVEGIFSLSTQSSERVRQLLTDDGVEVDSAAGSELTVRREILATGRTRCFVNDQLISLARLRELQPFLVEIHGQSEQLSLLSTPRHLLLFDEMGATEAQVGEVTQLFTAWRVAKHELQELEADAKEREKQTEYLRYQLEAIERLRPESGEVSRLREEVGVLGQGARLTELSSTIHALLYDDEVNVLGLLGTIRRQASELAERDTRPAPQGVAHLLTPLEEANVVLQDLAESFRSYRDQQDFSPERLAAAESRLAELERLQRTLGLTTDDFEEFEAELGSRLDRLENLDDRRRTAEQRVNAAATAYLAAASRLSEVRRTKVAVFEAAVERELASISMAGSRFRVVIDSYPDASERWGARGFDTVEFLLAANVGDDPRPLAKVASGGELSRIMLTLRVLLHTLAQHRADAVQPTIIFDEIDAGIGGQVAGVVGQRLHLLATEATPPVMKEQTAEEVTAAPAAEDLLKPAPNQLLCITHQAQIARFADHHFYVRKSVEEGRTLTRVSELRSAERATELARMIGGDTTAAAALEMARWMLSPPAGGAAVESRNILPGPTGESSSSERAAVKSRASEHE